MTEEVNAQATTQSTAQTGKRPAIVTVFCILSFIGSGFGIIMWLFFLIGLGSILSFLGSVGIGGIGGGSTAFLAIMAVLNIGTLIGAIMIFRMKKTGFYIYAVSYLAQIIVPIVFVGFFFSIGWLIQGIVIPAAFIIVYGSQMKNMS